MSGRSLSAVQSSYDARQEAVQLRDRALARQVELLSPTHGPVCLLQAHMPHSFKYMQKCSNVIVHR